MEEFRELALLLRNYSADAQIQVIDNHTIKQFPFWETDLPDDNINQPIANGNELSALNCQDKLQLRTRFWNTLLFLDLNQEELSDASRVAYLCWQRLATLKTLMAAGAIKSLKEIAEPLLQTAKEYELTLILIETATQLRQLSALHDGNMIGFDHYCQLIGQYEQVLKAEQAADDEYDAFLMEQINPASNTDSLIQFALNACQRLEPYAQSCKSASFMINLYFLRLQAAVLQANWTDVVRIGGQADRILRGKAIVQTAKVSAFLLSQALGIANLGDLKLALETIDKAIALEVNGSRNWYRLQELKIRWLLHQNQYPAALDLCKVLNGKNKVGEWDIDQKRLFHTTLMYLSDQKSLPISTREKGILMTHWIPMWGSQLDEMDIQNPDHEASILLLQLPKWVGKGQAGALAARFRHYLITSKACAPQSARFEVLIETLEALSNTTTPDAVIKAALQKLQALRIDYSAPEAAPEILRIEHILQMLQH
ncbi:hypothetical protein [Haliscomenobacter sp.]|uniref:hypothetical protein n=1 Tax=Haliscomenobacter sp. TaxID=2717303 RepID=UPI003364B9F8